MPDPFSDLDAAQQASPAGPDPFADLDQGLTPVASNTKDIFHPRLGAEGGYLAGMRAGQRVPGAETAKSIVLNAVPTAAGMTLGGIPGAMAGSAAGNTLDQWTRPGDSPFKWGEAAATVGLSAIPGASLAKAPVSAVVKQGLKYGAAGVTAENVRTGIDEGRMATAKENALAGGLGALSAPLAKFFDSGKGPGAAAASKAASRDSVRAATLNEARKAGYVVPAAAGKVNESATNNMLESIGGKAAVGQAAVAKNQEVTNSLAKQAIGLPDDLPITLPAIRSVRDEAGKAYEAVAAISPQSAHDLEALKQARFDKNIHMGYFSKSGNPEALTAGKKAGALVDSLEAKLEQTATAAGQPELVSALKNARTTIAKTYVVENALNEADGNISASAIGKAFDKGRPLTGELATIGKFHEAFPGMARDFASIPAAGVSKLKAIEMATGAAAGYHFGGVPGAVAGGTAALTPDAARSLVLSRYYQNSPMASPNYGTVRPDFMANLARYMTLNAGQQTTP